MYLLVELAPLIVLQMINNYKYSCKTHNEDFTIRLFLDAL